METKKSQRPAAHAAKAAPAAPPTARTKHEHVLLLAGTRHGLFLYRSGPDRRRFEPRGVALLGLDVADCRLDPRTGVIYAAASGRGAAGVYLSRDLGKSWVKRGTEIGAAGFSLIAFGPDSAPKTLYAAATPALLHRSTDGGENWHPVYTLNEHPSRREWQDLGCGLSIQALVQDPKDPDRLWVAITGAGVLRSDDGGLSWIAKDAGLPSHAPHQAVFEDVGRCPHNLALAPRGALYVQGHDGFYRSHDRGESWSDRSRDLPTRSGQALAVHPHDDVVWVVPESPQALTTNGDLAVWRARGGRDWERIGRGLPGRAHVGVAPRALFADFSDPVGLYLGTSSGRVFASADEGLTFTRMAEDLPEIRSVHAARIED